jgi:hypothetical protein
VENTVDHSTVAYSFADRTIADSEVTKISIKTDTYEFTAGTMPIRDNGTALTPCCV